MICHRCNDSGTVGLSTRTGNYRAPGPVPEDARGVCEATCDECNGRSEPEFVTRYDPPPIPPRFFDWTAVTENYEPGCPVGYGVTEEDAINHLLDQIQESAT